MTEPTKWAVHPAKTQISLGVRRVWSESSLSAWRKLGSLATHEAHSEDSDQTGQMPRLIWVFAGCTDHFVGFEAAQIMKMPSEDSDQPVHLCSLTRVFAVCLKMVWVLSHPYSAKKDWSNSWAVQTDLRLHRTHVILLVLLCCGSNITLPGSLWRSSSKIVVWCRSQDSCFRVLIQCATLISDCCFGADLRIAVSPIHSVCNSDCCFGADLRIAVSRYLFNVQLWLLFWCRSEDSCFTN